jgi:endonuclease YncB( thermonuclease family)
VLAHAAWAQQQQPAPYKPMPTPTWITPLSLTGTAHVVDGETVDLAAQRIRLYGIAALELNQTCRDGWGGADALRHLEDLIGHKPVKCNVYDRDNYGRPVAICYNAQGVDLNEMMVRDGYAYAYVYFSTIYIDTERAARQAERGMHGRVCDVPLHRPE